MHEVNDYLNQRIVQMFDATKFTNVTRIRIYHLEGYLISFTDSVVFLTLSREQQSRYSQTAFVTYFKLAKLEFLLLYIQ